jgi:acyl carrier protein
MAAYEDDPEANSASFSDGWFRTGDLGAFDADGYLFLRGRLKELINRGGEKIAPREVEEALLEHPAVAEAVAFPVPDTALGETVGAAVVLRAGASLRELRSHAAERIAHFKVPQHLALVAAIPKGPTGKLQRSGLAAQLGLGGSSEDEVDRSPPRTPLERRLCALWADLLGIEAPGIHAGFLELGGDSLTATRLLARVRDELGVEVSLVRFFEAPSVAGLAAILAGRPDGLPAAPTPDGGR